MKRFIIALALISLISAYPPTPASADVSAYEPLRPGAPGAAGRRTHIVEAIEKARPAVVSVYAQINVGVRGGPPFARSPFHDKFFNDFFGDMWPQRSRPGITLGSGVVIDGRKGLVVTNEHVVRGAASLTVTLSDGRELPAEILGSDPRFDLAVLSVQSSQPLPDLKLGDSDELMIGETVIAIGNPFGLSHTATTGVVSATGRTLPGAEGGQPLQDLIQTDASINPGNSGGPLLNINGEIIGLNTAIHAQGEGLGFAIPSNQIRRISTRLARGEANDAALDLGLELAGSGRPKRGETGCLVVEVRPGGPGAAGGLRKGDMLMKLDGSPTSTLADYEMIISSLSPGQSIEAEVIREGRPLTLSLRPQVISEAEALNLAWTLYGLKVYEKQGRLVLERPADKSPAQGLGIKEGDVLLGFAGREVNRPADLAKAVLETRFQSSVNVAVQRGRTIYRATLNR